MNKFSLSFFGLLLCASLAGLCAQDGSGFSFSLDPYISIPMQDSPSELRYTTGGGASLHATLIPPGAPLLRLGGSVDYNILPHISGESMQLAGAAALAGLKIPILTNLHWYLQGKGGYSFGQYASTSSGTPYAQAQTGMDLYLTPSFKVGVSGAYQHYFSASEALYQGYSISLGAGINISQLNRRSKVEFQEIIIQPVFPVFYSYYDTNPIGHVRIRNGESGPIKNVTISLFISQYMDSPKVCAVIPELRRGEEREVPLYAIFNRSVLSILETTKSQAEISVSYSLASAQQDTKESEVLSLNHRNAMNWKDDRRAAAFVTMNDPEIMRFSRQVAGLVRAEGYQTMDTKFRQAMGLVEALSVYGLNYVIDPNTPFAAYSENIEAVDYLQFPMQTMEFHAGDCDDLSILLCAVLESAGVETAFITVPGHIFTAFTTDMNEKEARSFFAYPEDLIIQNDNVWIPVEATAISSGFMRSWQLGARQWRDSAVQGEAVLLPVHEAWTVYEPVAMNTGSAQVEVPAPEIIRQRYLAAMNSFTERDLSSRLAELKGRIQNNNNDARIYNHLGVLYARFGQLDQAELNFKNALSLNRSSAALYNMGNVYYLKAMYKEALAVYQEAHELSRNNISILEALIRTAYESDERELLSQWLEQLAALDSKAAERMTAATKNRASTMDSSMSWEE